MDSQMEANCREWCKSHYWQLQERRAWRYAFHESVMVRYYEEANLDPTLLEPLVEFLKGDAWHDSFTVHNKPVDMSGWKTRDVWYETREGDVKEATKLKRTRIYHAVYKDGDQSAGDGPYVVENGCKWKVSHVFYWRVASLPSLPESTSGVQYRLQGVARDDETGLWNCVVERRETVQQDVPSYESAETTFEKRYDEQHLGVKQAQVEGTGKAASAGGGVMVRRQLRKNEDCTTDVINETVQEKPVSGAVTETARLMRGTRTVVVNRNQPTKAELGAADISVRNELTEGGLWNQTVTTFARILGWFRRMCRKTIFLHEHSETEVTDQDPGFTHVAEAGGGVIREKTVTRNDEGGFDVETRTREEQNVPGAVVETQKFIDGVQVTTVNRGQPAAASAAGLKIGERVRNEKTEGGLIDQTITQASVEPVGRTGEACEKNALVHTHSRTEGMGTQAQQVEVEAAAGQAKTRRVRLTERGAWEVTDETRTAKPAQVKVTVGTDGKQTTVTTFRNAPSLPVAPGGPNTETDATANPNEFGLVDGTVRTTTYTEKGATGRGGTVGTKVTTETHRDAPTAPQDEPGGVNKVVDVSVTQNDHGSYDYTKRTTEYEEKSETARSGTMLADEERTSTINTQDAADFVPQKGVVYDASAQPNGMGAKNMTVVKRTAKPQKQPFRWQDKYKTSTGYSVYDNLLIVFRNQETVPVEEDEWDSCSPGFGINEFGLLDGTLHYKSLVEEVRVPGDPGDGGMTYSGEITVVMENGTEETVPFTTYRNARGVVSSGFLDGAKDYPYLRLKSSDTGTSGIKYG